MTRERPSQLELFSRDDDSEQLIARPVDSGIRDYIRLYEKAVLLIIAFVITGIVAFCLGVEKGKKVALTGVNSRFDVAARQEIQPVQPPPKPQSPDADGNFLIRGQSKNMPVKQEIILKSPQDEQANDGYTIQIASYQAKDGAEKEMAKLRQTGFSPLVLKKGGYSVVCVGNFTNKESAKSLLSQLRSKYRDCYIRRL